MASDAPATVVYPRKSWAQVLWDFLGIPFRLVLMPQDLLPKFGWTTLAEERFRIVLPQIRGRLLDVGAYDGSLVRAYGGADSVGVDVFDWGGETVVVESSAELPFEDASFDTVTMVACLNHIPYREAALAEAVRLLRPGGRVVITMIDPLLGGIGHAIWWYSEDKHRGGMIEGERGGLWNREIIAMAEAVGLRFVLHRRFVYGLNNLLVFELAG